MNRFILVPCVLFVTLTMNSCAFFSRFIPPEGYIPDDKVVYLKEKIEFEPIRYEPQQTAPYQWSFGRETGGTHPGLVDSQTFAFYLKPSFTNDAMVYKEVRNRLEQAPLNTNYLRLRELLDTYPASVPAGRPAVKGAKTQDFQNAVEYDYPPVTGGRIMVFNNGDLKITLPDGTTYQSNVSSGNYFESDGNRRERFAVFPSQQYFRVTDNGKTFSFFPDGQRVIEEGASSVAYFISPQNEYKYETGTGLAFIFFLDPRGTLSETAMERSDKIRFDYFPGNRHVMITLNQESVVIQEDFKKSHLVFNPVTRKATNSLSYYFPEGIRIKDLRSGLTSSEIFPAWPEGYKERAIGPFRVLYTEKDAGLLTNIKAGKLNELSGLLRKATASEYAWSRALILPPDLQSYRKLHAGESSETMNWYPSGFETKDLIVMWPPSVPRYNLPEGQAYFWGSEFNEILVHELTHLLAGELTGVFSPVPVWLNEGLAVYVESLWSPDSRKYWEITFRGDFVLSKLLPWDDITRRDTASYEASAARTHYAQSYKMVSYLVGKFGMPRVVKYLKSFKNSIEEDDREKKLGDYQGLFQAAFDTTWEQNLADFNEYLKKDESYLSAAPADSKGQKN